MPIRIRELKPAELPNLYPLIRQMNPALSKPQFTAFLKRMQPEGYRAAGVFDGATLVACSGFWLRTRFWCGRQLDIDNFVVGASSQGAGIGRKLVQWLEAKAKAEQCDLIVLDSYTGNHTAQAFYLKQGFALTGFHLTKVPGSQQIGALPTHTPKH